MLRRRRFWRRLGGALVVVCRQEIRHVVLLLPRLRRLHLQQFRRVLQAPRRHDCLLWLVSSGFGTLPVCGRGTLMLHRDHPFLLPRDLQIRLREHVLLPLDKVIRFLRRLARALASLQHKVLAQ